MHVTALGRASERQAPPPDPRPGEELLVVEDLTVEFTAGHVRTRALRGVNLRLCAGEILGVAGESGSGKTTAALAAMGLLPRGAQVTGSIRYRDTELLTLPERQLRQYRGRHLAMIFQETASALNPVMRVGDQLMMAARAHVPGGRDEVRRRVATALDVSVQQEILELIRGLVSRRQLAVMLISHDLAVLSEVCNDLAVMYRGRVVETGAARDVLRQPAHPYTRALLDCIPTLHGSQHELREITPAQREAIEAASGGSDDPPLAPAPVDDERRT